MHGQVAPHARSVWADLDAIVLQEVKALRSVPPRPAEPQFGSDEEFMDRATAYLEGRGEEAHLLVDRLRDMLGPAADADMAATDVPREVASGGGIYDVAPPDVAPPQAEPPQAEQDT
ncbi:MULTISPECIES: hypothetical protein [unclassified Mesorhizobium]|uniref:hypothetical protein n=1 Tax=unclassified Mesorhizobium TaxID=325217 RepID=UPI000FC9CC6D|nr:MULTISPECIES: hypothetical protein [unclassified Mesorhizobium]RVD49250.1 hypothetical protein EN746_21595 [Mesorhizobium sp. M8A.F.Ca.ET.023.02.2.1]TGU99693.1 hypothetical protein EN794_002925 [Mesorhizobium sp. M00.F.Ca.ET.151.01.1.1]TGV15273.1 hypothetical protein EN816_07630 [Mesorhizobium sp. M8A.F.Ca.ET.173.01.1.1]TGV53999.1 hypothetical protein EN784_37945 [bacterium M00.F.Ca.ET.141.01.1.1]RUW43492.1 hypothetical protein EOA36_34605 [Mesorhizobium sp. M8A.F.Ca.ET.021.01.1.1]